MTKGKAQMLQSLLWKGDSDLPLQNPWILRLKRGLAPAGRAGACPGPAPPGLLSGSWAVKRNGWDLVSWGERGGA